MCCYYGFGLFAGLLWVWHGEPKGLDMIWLSMFWHFKVEARHEEFLEETWSHTRMKDLEDEEKVGLGSQFDFG